MLFTDTIVNGIAQIGGKIIDRLWPDPEQAAKAKIELFKLQQSGELAMLAADTDLRKAAADIIQSEAKSESWLTRTWRPITMLTFTTLIVARWMGFAAPNLSEAEYLKLWDIVELGLGGYVVGRSVEKALPGVLNAMTGKQV